MKEKQRKYPRYFAAIDNYIELKFVILKDEYGFGKYVWNDGSSVFANFDIEDLKRNYKEIPIHEAVLM